MFPLRQFDSSDLLVVCLERGVLDVFAHVTERPLPRKGAGIALDDVGFDPEPVCVAGV